MNARSNPASLLAIAALCAASAGCFTTRSVPIDGGPGNTGGRDAGVGDVAIGSGGATETGSSSGGGGATARRGIGLGTRNATAMFDDVTVTIP